MVEEFTILKFLRDGGFVRNRAFLGLEKFLLLLLLLFLILKS